MKQIKRLISIALITTVLSCGILGLYVAINPWEQVRLNLKNYDIYIIPINIPDSSFDRSIYYSNYIISIDNYPDFLFVWKKKNKSLL